MIVKILGMIDLISAFTFLMLIFGINVFVPLLLFCAGLLFLKGMFIFTGEIFLSLIDLLSFSMLVLSIFFALPQAMLWIPAFLLLAKGFVSFF